MKKQSLGIFFVKIATISCILVVAFQFISIYWEDKQIPEAQELQDNLANFSSAYVSNYATVGVALSTRIGIWFTGGNTSYSANSFYKEVSFLWASSEEKKSIRKDLISSNMVILSEYLNLSRSDIKSLLDSSTNRASTLEWFISQLEFRYKNSALSIQSLENQKAQLVSYLEEIDAKIQNTKVQMESDFSSGKVDATIDDVDQYFALRQEYTQTFTDIVFINQFIKQHSFLNAYNTGILDTLINNKTAIINQTYVVIPDSGDQYLRPLELIFDEAEIKAQKTED